MANKMKKTLAMVLAVSLCVSQLALPAAAANPIESPNAPQITVTDSSTSTVVDPATGAEITIEAVKGTTADGSTVEKETTVTTDTTVGDNGFDTTVDSSWTETTTTTQPDGDKSVSVTTGSDNEYSTVVANLDGSQTYAQGGSGSEETVTKGQESGEVIITDKVLDDKFDSGDNTVETPTGSSSDSTDTGWQEGEVDVNENGWQQVGGEQEGTEQKGETTTTQGATVLPEPNLSADAKDDVKLELTAGDKKVTISVPVTLEDLEAGKYPEIYKPAAGRSIQKVFDEQGNHIGFKVTEKVLVNNPGSDSASAAPGSKPTLSNEQLGKEVKTSDTIDSYEEKLTQGTVTTGADGSKTSVVETADKDTGVTTTTTVQTIIDKNGNKGYRETKVTVIPTVTTTVTTPVDPDDTKAAGYQDTQKKESKYLELPAKPAAVAYQDNGDGSYTVVEVKDILGAASDYTVDGQHVGYEVITTTYNMDGDLLSTHNRELYGTAVTETITTVTDPVSLTTTTMVDKTLEEITEAFAASYTREATLTATEERTYTIEFKETVDYFTQLDGKEDMYFVYEGQMFKAEANGDNSDSITFNLASSENIDISKFGHEDGVQDAGHYMIWKDGTWQHSWNGMFADDSRNNSAAALDSDPNTWELDGNGLYSRYFIATEDFSKNGGSHETKMYQIRNKLPAGTKLEDGTVLTEDTILTRYVYCVELNATAVNGSNYTELYFETDGSSTGNAQGNTYFKGNESYFASVALNGFWGTGEGTGSLAAVKELLKKYGYTDAAENITAGQALTATQAAIWKEGSPGGSDFNGDNFVWLINSYKESEIEKDTNYNKEGTVVDKLSKNIYDLYELLTTLGGKAETNQSVAQAVTADSIKTGSINVKQSLTDSTGTKYLTDMAFSLGVSANSINDNMTVTLVDQQGNELGTYRLSGELKEGEKSASIDKDGNVTLTDVTLEAGQEVSLQLNGTQHLSDGIYVYNNKTSQDFLGLATKMHNVALKFGMLFNLIDPEFSHKTETTPSYKTNTLTYKTDASRTDTRETGSTSYTASESVRTQYVSQLNGIVTSTQMFDKVTLERARWNHYYEYLLTVVDDEDGGDETVIFEEEVPLAAAPKTGDASLVMAMMSALSMAGATILGRKKEEE